MAIKKETAAFEAEYTVEEFTSCTKAVFGEAVSPDIVTAAFKVAGVTKTTKSNAIDIINKFRKKEVK